MVYNENEYDEKYSKMDQKVHVIIYKHRLVFDRFLITPIEIIQYSTEDKKDDIAPSVVPLNKKGFNAYLVSAYVTNLKRSNLYRNCALKTLLQLLKNHLRKQNNEELVILIKLRTPKQQFIDYKWNERIMHMVYEHQEIEYAMSWLSTLGGAFSALGDTLQHCAAVAGKISIKQFKLALQLGDPHMVARCKVYAALSLIQQNYLSQPKQMILEVFSFAKKHKDIRLQRMCQGIWAKLKYQHILIWQKRENLKKIDQIK